MTYSVTGPFTDGSAPPVDQAFLNNVETWIESIDAPSAVTLSGGSSGTATLYQWLNGTVKSVIVRFNNFKTAGSAQNLVLPTPFTTCAQWRTSQTGTFSLTLSGTAQNLGIITALSASGGTVTIQTTAAGYSIGDIGSGFDTIKFAASDSTGRFGQLVLRGI